jgi:RimJ/RimL family protein N-acetyltransferase
MPFVLPGSEGDALALRTGRCLEDYNRLLARNWARLAQWEPWAEHPFDPVLVDAGSRVTLSSFLTGRILPLVMLHHGRVVGSAVGRISGAVGEVGYWIDQDFEGRGIAARTVRRLVAELFARGADSVELRTTESNVRSQRLARRLGFTHRSTVTSGVRFRNRSEDLLVFAATPRQLGQVVAAAPHGFRRVVDDDVALVVAEPYHARAMARLADACGCPLPSLATDRGRQPPACLVTVGGQPMGLVDTDTDTNTNAGTAGAGAGDARVWLWPDALRDDDRLVARFAPALGHLLIDEYGVSRVLLDARAPAPGGGTAGRDPEPVSGWA